MLKILGISQLIGVYQGYGKMNNQDMGGDLMAMYNYGLIQGKRMERAKRKIIYRR